MKKPSRAGQPASPKSPQDPRLATARRLHQSGDTARAETLYRQILANHPDLVEALYLLGTLLAQRGDYPDALPLLLKATRLNPRHSRALNNLGITQHKLGQLNRSTEHYQAALALDPDYAEARSNLGDVLREQGEFAAAERELRRAIALDARHAEAHNNLGLCLMQAGKWAEAESAWCQAVALRPDYALAWRNLGHLCQRGQRLQDAHACYQRALTLHPQDAVLQAEAGAVAQQSGDLAGAMAHYRQALTLHPGDAAALNNLGAALLEMGALNDAMQHFLLALQARPVFPEAYNNLGNTLMQQGHAAEGMECYRQAIVARPGYTQAHSNLLLALNYQTGISPEEIYAEHRAWARAWQDTHAPWPAIAQEALQNRRVRIGYVSADFRTHSVAYFFLPILRHHDPARVEIFCYSDVLRPDMVTQECRRLAHHWSDITGLTDEVVAARIAQDRIDILVDLCGHMHGNRLSLFARRAAPRQLTYLGYPNTTGLDNMDYRLTDTWADPPGGEAWHSEKLLRLPRGFLCYAPPSHAPQPGPPPVLAAGHITFGSFNNLAKITPPALALWAGILKQLPGARLIVKNKSLRDAAVRARYTALFAAQGVGAERLELVGWLEQGADHLSLYQRVDIALDTFPYNGTTTTCEALWMGVPVIALCGVNHASRVCASLLSRVGLQELLCNTEDEYSAVAIHLAGAVGRLVQWRSDLRRQMQESSLCQADAFTRTLEQAYEEILNLRQSD